MTIWLLAAVHSLMSQDLPVQNISTRSTEGPMIDRSKYIKFTWANDALTTRGITDRYFTNGNTLEYYYVPRRPERYQKIFFRLPDNSPTRNNNFAISLTSNMYTPKDISNAEVDSTDRPYAGWLSFSVKCISNEFATSERLTTEYSIGIMGPHAYQKEIQTWFHELIDSQKPMGWHNQISDDIAVNMRVDYEKGLLRPLRNLEVIGLIEANFGSITNYMGIGSTIRIGSFNDYFINELGLRTITKSDSSKLLAYKAQTNGFKTRKTFEENLIRNTQFFLFVRWSGRAVIDNALLQGGLINWDKCPYVLKSDQIDRFYFNAEFGLNITYRGVGVVLSQLFRTSEFSGAFETRWGAITVVFRIR